MHALTRRAAEEKGVLSCPALRDPVYSASGGAQTANDGRIIRNDGQRSVLLSVLKIGNASTVADVSGVRNILEMARDAWQSKTRLMFGTPLQTTQRPGSARSLH
jgi:hypothetical protein